MPANANETKSRLILAAEELLAIKGIDAVSLREINVRAGQKNTSAVRYHFGDLAGIIEAILLNRMVALEAMRADALDALDMGPTEPSIQAYMTILISPIADKVCGAEEKDADPGWGNYVQLLAQLSSAKGHKFNSIWQGKIDLSFKRLFGQMHSLLPHLTPKVYAQREEDLVGYVLNSLSNRVTQLSLGIEPALTRDEFLQNIYQVAAAILLARANE